MGKRRRVDWSKIKRGSLTAWLKRNRAKIKRSVGDPFTKTGEINDNVLRKLYKNERLLKRLSPRGWKRIKRKVQFKLDVLEG